MTSRIPSCTVLTNATANNDADAGEHDAFWIEEIDSLAFRPSNHRGQCVMHRRALRVLLGRDATSQQCLDYFRARRVAFERAARAKIARAALREDARFHINSRDLRAAL